jgi:hypothetical protein
MMTLGCAIVAGRFDILDRTVGSVRPWVDRIFVLVDTRAPDAVRDYLTAEGVPWEPYAWEDHFVRAFLKAGDGCGTDWVLHLDSDEELAPESGPLIRGLVDTAGRDGTEGYVSFRRHWRDLAKTQEFLDWHPNRRVWLRRNTMRYEGRVHAVPPPGARLVRGEHPVVEHYNLALRSPEEFAAAHEYYCRLEALEAGSQSRSGAWDSDG